MRNSISFKTKAMQIQMYAWFSKQNHAMCLLDSRKSMSSTHTIQTSESYCISSLLLSYFIYTYFLPPLHSFSRWVKVMFGVALKTRFSQVNFLSNKIEFANTFYQTKCTCFLFSFQLGTHTGQGNVKFFSQSWIQSFSVSISVFSMYIALT